jgi:hypothetical protein
MKIAVYDTNVTKNNGEPMHFDVLVPTNASPEKAIAFGNQYLEQTGQVDRSLTSKECGFCHIEDANPNIAESIRKQGYYIHKIEGCS